MSKLGINAFETLDDMDKRQASTLKRLTNIGLDSALGASLRACNSEECGCTPCRGACWYAWRRERLTLIPQAIKLFAERPAFMVTIVRSLSRRGPDMLPAFSLDGFKQTLSRRLRTLKKPVLAFGSIEVSWNKELDGTFGWSPHAHLVVAGATADELHRAFDPHGKSTRKRTLVMAKPVTSLGGALAYSIKRKPDQRIAYIADNGRTARRKMPLKDPMLAEYDAWLASLSIHDPVFLFGLRRHGDTLVPTLMANDVTK